MMFCRRTILACAMVSATLIRSGRCRRRRNFSHSEKFGVRTVLRRPGICGGQRMGRRELEDGGWKMEGEALRKSDRSDVCARCDVDQGTTGKNEKRSFAPLKK